MLVAGAVLAMFGFQVFVNIGMTVGIMPITGIPLPLMSYGGSHTITTFVAVGLLLGSTGAARPSRERPSAVGRHRAPVARHQVRAAHRGRRADGRRPHGGGRRDRRAPGRPRGDPAPARTARHAGADARRGRPGGLPGHPPGTDLRHLVQLPARQPAAAPAAGRSRCSSGRRSEREELERESLEGHHSGALERRPRGTSLEGPGERAAIDAVLARADRRHARPPRRAPPRRNPGPAPRRGQAPGALGVAPGRPGDRRPAAGRRGPHAVLTLQQIRMVSQLAAAHDRPLGADRGRPRGASSAPASAGGRWGEPRWAWCRWRLGVRAAWPTRSPVPWARPRLRGWRPGTTSRGPRARPLSSSSKRS